MTPDEFPQWLAHLAARAPSLAAHLALYPQLRHGWSMDLCDYRLDEALRALDVMAADPTLMGPVEERDFFPFYVSKVIKAERGVKAAEQQAAEDAAKHEYPERGAWAYVTKGPGMKEAYEKTVEYRKKLRAEGKSQEEINRLATEYVRQLFADMPEDRRDRWKCLTCRDTGWVQCFGTLAMQQARAHLVHGAPLDEAQALRASQYVSCNCTAGRVTWQDRKGGRAAELQLPRFNTVQWVPLSAGIEGLLEWAQKYVPPYLKGQTEWTQEA